MKLLAPENTVLSLGFVLLTIFSSNLFAADAPVKKSMQTKSGLYVNAVEAFEMLVAADGENVLLVDVRDPVEIKFTGYTDLTDIHVPWKIIDTSKWDKKKQSYGGYINPDFAKEVDARLADMGADKDTHIIFMCRSGSTRSAPAADVFYDKGYKNVYSMVDGFEGGKAKSGMHKGARVITGWKNSSLPWGWKLEKGVAYGS